MSANWIHLGRCHKAHGVRGGASLHLLSGEDSVLRPKMRVQLRPFGPQSELPSQGRCYTLRELSRGKRVACLEGVEGRDQIEALIPFDLFLERRDFPPLPVGEGQFYLADLLGLKAIDHRSKRELGMVVQSLDNTAQTLLDIRDRAGKPLFLLPFVNAFFPAVNVEAGWIEVNPPEVV